MDEHAAVIRESRGRRYLGFLLFLLIGAIVLILQGVLPNIRGIRIEWFFLVIVYVGIYKPPAMSVLLTFLLGILLDLYSGGVFGTGLFCSFFVMGASRLISRIIYAERTLVLFVIAAVVSFFLNLVVLSAVASWGGASVVSFGWFILRATASAFMTALAGIIFLPLLKYIDPERGGYYLARFMREERGEPLV
jgi:rod shape-determining protein MreD